jgi:hypothetical protein
LFFDLLIYQYLTDSTACVVQLRCVHQRLSRVANSSSVAMRASLPPGHSPSFHSNHSPYQAVHVFLLCLQECVDKWLQKSQLCPLCNQNVTQAHNLHASTPGSSSVPLPPALPNQPIDEADAAAVAGGVAEGCSVDIEPIEVRSSPVAIQIDSSA